MTMHAMRRPPFYSLISDDETAAAAMQLRTEDGKPLDWQCAFAVSLSMPAAKAMIANVGGRDEEQYALIRQSVGGRARQMSDGSHQDLAASGGGTDAGLGRGSVTAVNGGSGSSN